MEAVERSCDHEIGKKASSQATGTTSSTQLSGSLSPSDGSFSEARGIVKAASTVAAGISALTDAKNRAASPGRATSAKGQAARSFKVTTE